MPGYKDHKTVTFVTSVLTAGAVFVGYQITYRVGEKLELLPPGAVDEKLPNTLFVMGLVTAGVMFGGTLNSPDLDTPSTPYNHWGIFRFIWLPYQIMIKHRSPFSHWPVLASVFKLTYLFVMLNLVIDALILMANLWFIAIGDSFRVAVTIWQVAAFLFQPLRYPVVWVFIVGDVIGETSHIITDWLDGRRRMRYWNNTVPTLSDGEVDTPYNNRDRYGSRGQQ